MAEKSTGRQTNSGIDAASAVATLSRREQEIARLYCRGQTSTEIAHELCVSPTTVRNHVAAIYRKLAISNKAELIHLIDWADGTTASTASVATNQTDAPRQSDTSPTQRSLVAVQAQLQAINDVLRVISHTPGDLDSIFDVILDYALQLSHSQLGIVYRYDKDGFKATGLKNVPEAFHRYLVAAPIVPNAETGIGRMAKQRRIIHIHDVRSENVYLSGDPLRKATVELGGARSFLAIPMTHRDELIGAFTIYRQEVKPFTDDELGLLQAFSDQASIALTITRLIDASTAR